MAEITEACPCCAGTTISGVYISGEGFRVECSCGAYGPTWYVPDLDRAIKMWNDSYKIKCS